MKNSVYFRRLAINEQYKTVSLYCSSEPLTQSTFNLDGLEFAARRQSQELKFGLLPLIDPKTGKSLDPKHPNVKTLQAKYNVGDEMVGIRITDVPVINRETGEAVPNLFWAEPA